MTKLAKLLISEIKQELTMLGQNEGYPDLVEQTARTFVKLEALVELGEIRLCGSVGGFDSKGNQPEGQNLEDRAEHVIKQQHRL